MCQWPSTQPNWRRPHRRRTRSPGMSEATDGHCRPVRRSGHASNCSRWACQTLFVWWPAAGNGWEGLPACGPPLPADDFEKAVIAALVAIYSNDDFIKRAVADARAAATERRAELINRQ